MKKKAAVDKNITQYKVVKNHVSTVVSYNRTSVSSIIANQSNVIFFTQIFCIHINAFANITT